MNASPPGIPPNVLTTVRELVAKHREATGRRPMVVIVPDDWWREHLPGRQPRDEIAIDGALVVPKALVVALSTG